MYLYADRERERNGNSSVFVDQDSRWWVYSRGCWSADSSDGLLTERIEFKWVSMGRNRNVWCVYLCLVRNKLIDWSDGGDLIRAIYNG